MTTTCSSCSGLSDPELLSEIARAAANERQATSHLVALLTELDTRRLYLGEGFSSLFTYCTQALHLSEHAAYNRIEAARAARRFPVILNLIHDGAVTLTAIRLLAPHLTPENYRDVLASARHKSKHDIERLVAGLHPQPDVRAILRRLPTPPAAVALVAPRANTTPAALEADQPQVSIGAGVAMRPAISRPELKPIAPERYKIQFTASRETYETLRRAQDLLRHSVPDGDPAVIVGRALTLLVAELERTKAAATDRPRPNRARAGVTRRIPADIKRAVWQRDGGRCAFIGALGRCVETSFLEYHHVVPFADGGEASIGNISLRCRAHNAHEARLYFGTTYSLFVPEEADV